MRKRRVWPVRASTLLVAGALIGALSSVTAASPRGEATPVARGGRISGVARPDARGTAARGLAPATTCSTPGVTNYKADCKSNGSPTNETTIAYNGTTFVAGANDYNSWNGNADLGYYTSTDAKTWTDRGPMDLFPHSSNGAAGDPGLAIDSAGVVYYSGISFDYADCNVGGLELARRKPSNGSCR